MDVPVTVHSLSISPGYLGSIHLKDVLTISGSDPASVLAMNGSGRFAGVFDQATQTVVPGRIDLNGTSTFLWLGGWLEDVVVTATPAAKIQVTPSVGGAIPRMMGTTFHVAGTLWWQSQTVRVDPSTGGAARSVIYVAPGGTFQVEGTGSWGNAGEDTSLLHVVNEGTVNQAAGGGNTLVADFINNGTTQLAASTLTIKGMADQARDTSVFQLAHGATVRVQGPGEVLRVREGRFQGTGTVDANLTLGYEDGTGAPDLRPGLAELSNGVGTLTITHSLHVFATGARTWIDVDGGGLFDQLLVGDYAVLHGRLETVIVAAYQPQAGTVLQFLMTANGVGEDFYTGITLQPHRWNHPDNPGQVLRWDTEKTETTYNLTVTVQTGDAGGGGGLGNNDTANGDPLGEVLPP